MNDTKQRKFKIKDIEKVKRFVLGMLGQYGRKWEDLTELQQATFEQDVDKLVNVIIFETYREALSNNTRETIEKVDSFIINNFETFSETEYNHSGKLRDFLQTLK